jgi:hypothetical protein
MLPNVPGPLNAQCGKCLYWEQHEKIAATGECKRYPPQVVMAPQRGGCLHPDRMLRMAFHANRRMVW